MSKISRDLRVQIHVRSCVMGEIFLSQRCVVCGVGTVGFGPHDEAFRGACHACPAHARCYGSTMIVPEDGFAAISPLTTAMQRCGPVVQRMFRSRLKHHDNRT